MKGYTIQHSIDLLEKAVENSGGGSGGGGMAADVSYSNTSSGLVATNVQAAIDEIDNSVDTNTTAIATINSKTIKFGTPASETISGLNAVNAKHTFVNAGLASVNIITSGSGTGYCYVSVNGVEYSGTTPQGYAGNLVIPVNVGDELTITQLSTGVSINAIRVVPIEFAAPTSNRTTKKK